jgi:membrane fusion protein (multidrug efflux system)
MHVTPLPRSSNHRSRLALAAALVLAAWPAASCAPGGGGGKGFQMPPTPVELAPVHLEDMRDEFHALGSIEALDNAQLVSEISGTVKSLPFIEGQEVKAGALLALLDDREMRASADHAEAQRQQAGANFDRTQKLAEQKVVSQSELDDSKSALQIAEADLELARVHLEKTHIRAPFDGAVGRRLTSVGAWLKPGDPVTNIARLSTLRVAFSAPERMLADLRPGREVRVRTPAWPDREFVGRLTVVDPIVDPDTRTVHLLAELPNPAGVLKPGLSADVSVTIAERKRALTIPDEAVFAEGNANFVYVVQPDTTVMRAAVQLGARDSSRVEILGGLTAGQMVVRTGHQKLYPGAHIMALGAAPGAGGAGPGSAGPGGAAGDPAKSAGAPNGGAAGGKTASARGDSSSKK